MKTSVLVATAILIGSSLTGVAHAQRKLNCVKDVTYSKEFLAKFPDAGSQCQEVRLVSGEKWVRFTAEVKSVKENRITVDPLNKEQRHMGDPLTFEFTPDATLTLTNNKVKAAHAVRKGDMVTVWVPESRFGLYAEPGASGSKQFKLVSEDPAK